MSMSETKQEKVDLEALEAVWAKATQGEWNSSMKLYSRSGFRLVQEDMDFIVFVHKVFPALIAELRELRKKEMQ